MEIKVQCNCGTRYKFDVEPVNGRTPTELACPACGASWTDYTNAMIAQALSASTPAAPGPAVSPAPLATPSPAPASASPTAARISLRVAPPTPSTAAAPAEATAQAQASQASAPTASTGRPITRVVTLDPLKDESKGNFGLGLLGAAAGALVGSLIYFAVFHYADARIKLLAVGVGFLAGLGGKLLAKEGCTELGLIAAALSIAGVVGAQYFITRSWWQAGSEIKPELTASAYDAEVKEAKEVIAAIPNGTEKEIRAYLAKEASKEEGKKVDPANVDSEEVGDFRDTTLPYYRDLASGKTTKEDYERKLKGGDEERDPKKEKEDEERTFKWVFLALTLSRFNIACMVGAAGLAYKVSS